ncbi:hypothetical protein E3N88_19513 [Mikania micrantha]|uniref:hAT-like transposase RNase-H fold domain-containing protein n=1 Tax=Mikania micrantha TaxID=192012 RepID=A0A5N6NRH1_9ASTR|nr:hypothetical protein E3N88_19513 [Mikania micrantha]
MSKMAHGVRARKQWMLPPLVGNRIVVPHGPVITPSLTSLAGRADEKRQELQSDLIHDPLIPVVYGKHVTIHPSEQFTTIQQSEGISDLIGDVKVEDTRRPNCVDSKAAPHFSYSIGHEPLTDDGPKFKEVFVNYADREPSYKTLLSVDDWKKVEDVCSFLVLFNEATKLISGSEYPTSNLFLSELYGIKETLDSVTLNEDYCMKDMVEAMKIKSDKYWGSCNLLISVGAVLDPRYKMKLIEFAFNLIYSNDRALEEILFVRDSLDELFKEYVESYKESNIDSSKSANVVNGPSGSGNESGSSFRASRFGKDVKTGSAKYHQHIRSVDCVESENDDVEMLSCLEESELLHLKFGTSVILHLDNFDDI